MDITYNEGTKIPERILVNECSCVELPKEYGKTWEDFMKTPISVLKQDGTILPSAYRLQNIHEFLKLQQELMEEAK